MVEVGWDQTGQRVVQDISIHMLVELFHCNSHMYDIFILYNIYSCIFLSCDVIRNVSRHVV